MTIVHKSGNIHKNADGLRRWALDNTPENAAWVAQEEKHIEGIFVTEIGPKFLIPVKESYNMEKNFHILFQLLKEENHIEGICVTDIGTELFNQVKESFNMEDNCHMFFQLLMNACIEPSLSFKLD
ncbi:hypothetical protein O181_055952 [Austropuccinia psidii MF-1]|uniref:Uncharacterized protein n=1 Tax=Austropuccinia psidii MF-1 TaxID=1389203 RepID=A0A9Q3HU03_9BASI|nr:hypothetical protein [Austropuccinia psidii MF-1]